MRAVVLFLVCTLASAFAQNTLTADEIMSRVAANQDRADQLRKQYVYEQHVHVASKQTNGRLMREETADYDVVPGADKIDKKLRSLVGRYFEKGKYVEFAGEQPERNGIDSDLTSNFRSDLVNDKSKDGLGRHLFPLTTKQQSEYQFRLLGEGQQDGRAVYRVAFTPRDRKDIAWAGEAFIDKEEFQPVYVFTKLNRKLPLLVRGVLGTDLPGVGFSVHYRRQADGVWFPVSFGTEFRLKILFMIKRDVTLSLDNRNFQHTHVDTAIKPLDSQ